MKSHRWSVSFIGAAALTLALAVSPSGCAVDGTGGALVELEMAFQGAALDGEALGVGTTLYDPAWTVELTEARLVLGAAYVFPSSEVVSAWQMPFVRRAYAHAGDDNLFGVNALTEWREQVVVDALSTEPTVVGPLLGEMGTAEVASVWIDAPQGELAGADGPTHGHHGWVAGTARRGDEEIRFEAGLTLEDTPLSQRVDRIPLGEDATVSMRSRVVIEVVAGQWLQQLDFDAMREDGDLVAEEDGVVRPTAPHPFQRSWLIDFHDPNAFRARIVGGEGQ